MNRLRACFKFAHAALHLVVGWVTIWLKFPGLTPAQRQMRVQIWSAKLLQCMGVQLLVRGNAAVPRPLLLVSNHISWLDITALHAARYCRFVSKADVKHWPVIGPLAAGVGTLFIERESRRDAMRVVHHMADSLRAGDVLGVFPEGTTSDGTHLLAFHGNLFQAAISANAPVQPVSIAYIDLASGQATLAASFVNDDTLFTSVWRTLCTQQLGVVITFGEPQLPQGRDRRVWATQMREEIAKMRAADFTQQSSDKTARNNNPDDLNAN